MSTDKSDAAAIKELRTMARIYAARGRNAQANKLLQLADQMEQRLARARQPEELTDTEAPPAPNP